jgi:hypothetical protein
MTQGRRTWIYSLDVRSEQVETFDLRGVMH